MPAKRFKFKLEGVLRLKRNATERARIAFGRNRQARRAQEDLLTDLHRRLEAFNRGDGAEPGCDLQTMRRHNAYRVSIQRTIETERRRLTELQNAEAESRARFIEARTEEETLEKLRCDAFQRHLQENAKAADAELDEFTQQMTARVGRRGAA